MKLTRTIEKKSFSFLSRWLAPALLKGIRLTSRFDVRNEAELSKLYPEDNFILAFWHGQMIPFVQYFLNSGFYTFASPHRDGDYVARMMEGMGQKALRTSLRDVQIGELVKGLKLAREGETLVVTPDGPVGPRMVAKPGIIKISRRTQLPILPAAGLATSAHFFSSWDRYCFPFPFGKIMLNFGAPIRSWDSEVSVEESAKQLEGKLRSLTGKLAEDCSVPEDYFEPPEEE